jgi:uncharacterized cupredoxin-like copper-binding protein
MRTSLLVAASCAVFVAVGLTACGPAQTAAPQTQTVTVSLTDSAIIASQTTFHPGVQYHFVVTNNGTTSHEFLIMPPGMAQMMSQMPMNQWRQQALHASGMLGPQMMAEFDYTFADMPMMQQGQDAAFGCYADGHPLMQMPITVNP